MEILTGSKKQVFTDANGYATVDHNAEVEPYFGQAWGLKTSGPDAGWQCLCDNYTVDTFRVRVLNSSGGVQANKIVEIGFVLYGPPA